MYLTAKFIDAYIKAKNDYIAEGKIDANTGSYLSGLNSDGARELADFGPIDMEASYIADRAKMARVLYKYGKYNWIPDEDPTGSRFDEEE